MIFEMKLYTQNISKARFSLTFRLEKVSALKTRELVQSQLLPVCLTKARGFSTTSHRSSSSPRRIRAPLTHTAHSEIYYASLIEYLSRELFFFSR